MFTKLVKERKSMYCFIHHNEEAIAVCKKCGKAMCQNCSAYSEHSGICPECRREEFIAERGQKTLERREVIKIIVILALLTVALLAVDIWLGTLWSFMFAGIAVILIGFGIGFIKKGLELKALNDRINYLTGEIKKLEAALSSGNAQI